MTDTIYADFNNMDFLGRVRLNTIGTFKDIKKFSIQFIEGDILVVSDGDLIADGILEFSVEEGIWVLNLNENTVQNC